MRRSILQLIIVTGILLASASCSFSQQSSVPEKWRPYVKLCDDVDKNDFGAVILDLRMGVDPNRFPDDGEARGDELDLAALCVAARNGNIAMINLLLDHGADPNISDGWDGNPLTAAADTDNVVVLQLLVKHGAKINDDSDGSRALWRAATGGKLKALRYLLSHGANPNTVANTGKIETILSATEFLGQPAAATILKKYGAKEKLK
jgi:hypothetical protein